jgi:hypothetical protein
LGEIEPGATRTGRLERAGVAPGSAGHIEHAPSGLKWHGTQDEGNGAFRLGVVTVRIQLKVLFAKPFFEPFSHGKRSRVEGLESMV